MINSEHARRRSSGSIGAAQQEALSLLRAKAPDPLQHGFRRIRLLSRVPSDLTRQMNPINAIKRAIPAKFKPLAYLQRLAMERTRGRVQAGPFAGQIISFCDPKYGMGTPKLLGLYERELHFIVEMICRHAPDLILNIGAGDGYYAIGFARRLPASKIIAFESESDTRKNLARNAELNEVSGQIEIRDTCGIAELRDVIDDSTRATIVCDVEGYENVLLDPIALPALKNVDILVETHDFFVPDVSQIISNRFSNSHNVTVLRQQPRSSTDFPWRTLITALFPKRYFELAVSEGRPETMTWLWMQTAQARTSKLQA